MKLGTFITFGNMPTTFPRMVAVVIENIHLLPKPIIIQAGSNVDLFGEISHSVRMFDFCSFPTFNNFLSNSEVIICHAGVGSVLGAIAEGVCPAIMPRRASFGEHVDDHQLEFMSELVARHLAHPVESQGALRKYLNARTYVLPEGADTAFLDCSAMIIEIQMQLRRFIV
jgi:UDP-N-acetylglucosamine transferase subunit ALG13